MRVLTETQRCRLNVVRAGRGIKFAIVHSPTPATGNRLAHIDKKIHELMEILEPKEPVDERTEQKPGG